MKKIVLSTVSLIIILIVIYFGIYFIQNKTLLNSYAKERNTEFGKERFLIRCNLNIFNPEFAYVFGSDESGHIAFQRINKMFYASYDDWENAYTGGTTIKNTTFPQLLKMVKEDCYQFQKDYNWSETWGKPEAKTELRWQWSRAETEKEKQVEKEKEEEEKKEFEKMLKEKGITLEEYIKQEEAKGLTEEEIKELDKEYGF